MKKRLFTKNLTLILIATILGAAGGIAGNFALSFFVFEETGSTFASSILRAIQVIPNVLLPLFISPSMDRHARKPYLVIGDYINSGMYLIIGIWLLRNGFSYAIYSAFSFLLAALNVFDNLAYTALFPSLIPDGFEEKGFSVFSMVYPVLNVIMSPISAKLLDHWSAAQILLLQSGLSLGAAIIESFIDVEETHVKADTPPFSFKLWWSDLKDAYLFLKKDKALSSIMLYASYMNGIGTDNIEVAFFSTTPGYTIAMYSAFTAAQFIGRTIAGVFCYKGVVPHKKRYKFILWIYHLFEIMEASLLWLPYPLMLVNRAFVGFLGMNSWTYRQTAVQAYIPEEYRARLNSFGDVINNIFFGLLSLLIGYLGEIVPYKWVLTVMGVSCIVFCRLTVCRNREETSKIFCINPSEARATE